MYIQKCQIKSSGCLKAITSQLGQADIRMLLLGESSRTCLFPAFSRHISRRPGTRSLYSTPSCNSGNNSSLITWPLGLKIIRFGIYHHSSEVRSSKSPGRALRLSRISIPGPMGCARRLEAGKTYKKAVCQLPHQQ